MYCSECGSKAAGKFCSQCGHALIAAVAAVDWRESLDAGLVAQVPEVQSAVQQAQRQAVGGVNGTQVVQLADSIASSLTGGVSSLAVAKLVQPLYAKFGMKTSKQRAEFSPLPTGEVIARLLVALARLGYAPAEMSHDHESCTIEVTMPVDLRGMEGTLRLVVTRHIAGTQIAAAAQIEGQWYDWGLCQSRVDRLFETFRSAA